MPSRWRIGPLTIITGEAPMVVAITPWMLNSSVQTASSAAITTGRYSGRHPARTAFTATFSTVAGAMFGGTVATTDCGSRRVPSRHAHHPFRRGRHDGQAIRESLVEQKLVHIVRRGDFNAARAQGAVLGLGAQALADHRILRQRPAAGAPVGQGVPVHRQFRRVALEEGTPLRLVEPDQAVRLGAILVRGDDQRHGVHVVGERHLERRVVEDRGGECMTLDQRRVALGGLAGERAPPAPTRGAAPRSGA